MWRERESGLDYSLVLPVSACRDFSEHLQGPFPFCMAINHPLKCVTAWVKSEHRNQVNLSRPTCRFKELGHFLRTLEN